jgi:hypothetical protein
MAGCENDELKRGWNKAAVAYFNPLKLKLHLKVQFLVPA